MSFSLARAKLPVPEGNAKHRAERQDADGRAGAEAVGAGPVGQGAGDTAGPGEPRPAARAAATAVFEEQARVAHAEGRPRAVLALLMSAYGDDVYRHCRQMVGSDALADDVHQEVFAQAFRDLPRFAGQSSFRTWLYAIARHRCLDALKLRRRFQRRFLHKPQLPEPADPRAAADVQLADRSTELALLDAMGRLKPKVRVAVLLRFQEDMSYAEMAEVCGERAATLQARVMRALPLLRAWLEKQGVSL